MGEMKKIPRTMATLSNRAWAIPATSGDFHIRHRGSLPASRSGMVMRERKFCHNAPIPPAGKPYSGGLWAVWGSGRHNPWLESLAPGDQCSRRCVRPDTRKQVNGCGSAWLSIPLNSKQNSMNGVRDGTSRVSGRSGVRTTSALGPGVSANLLPFPIFWIVRGLIRVPAMCHTGRGKPM